MSCCKCETNATDLKFITIWSLTFHISPFDTFQISMSVQVHHVLTEVYVLIVSMHLPVLVRLGLLGIDAKSVSICDRHPIVIGKLLGLFLFLCSMRVMIGSVACCTSEVIETIVEDTRTKLSEGYSLSVNQETFILLAFGSKEKDIHVYPLIPKQHIIFHH